MYFSEINHVYSKVLQKESIGSYKCCMISRCCHDSNLSMFKPSFPELPTHASFLASLVSGQGFSDADDSRYVTKQTEPSLIVRSGNSGHCLLVMKHPFTLKARSRSLCIVSTV